VKAARYALAYDKRLLMCEFLARANEIRMDMSIVEQVRQRSGTGPHYPLYSRLKMSALLARVLIAAQLQVLSVSAVLYRKCELFRKMMFHLRLAAELLSATGHPLNGLAVLKALVHLYDGTATLASEPSYAARVSQASGSIAVATAALAAPCGSDSAGEGLVAAGEVSMPSMSTDQVPGLPGNKAVSVEEARLLAWPRLQIALLQELIRVCDALEGMWRAPATPATVRR